MLHCNKHGGMQEVRVSMVQEITEQQSIMQSSKQFPPEELEPPLEEELPEEPPDELPERPHTFIEEGVEEQITSLKKLEFVPTSRH